MIGEILVAAGAVGGAALAGVALLTRRGTRFLDRRPALGAVAVALVALSISAGLGRLHPAYPAVQDEFSYLLAADTYAHGRLANPPMPLPAHFESFHIVVSPSHSSKYPPAQGLFLALGQVLFGSPIAGAWLAFAAACAALHWALRATLPARIALAGALFAALLPSFHASGTHAWTQTYWGGQAAFLGGALLFGSAARLSKRARAVDGVALGLGLALLALSRPFEGLLAAVLVSVEPIRAWLRGWRPSRRDFVARVAIPAAALVSLALGFQALVNLRVTGRALTMPYELHEKLYGAAPLALWLPQPAPKTYASEDLRRFYEESLAGWKESRTPSGFLKSCGQRFALAFKAFGWPLAAVWLGLPLVLPRARARRLLGTLLAAFAVLLTMTWLFPHYLAPFVAAGAALAARSARSLAAGRIAGPAAVLGALGFVAAWLLVAADTARRSDTVKYWPGLRVEIAKRAGDRSLVIVEKRSDASVHQEWVYNGADPAGATVLWARSLGPEKDRILIDRFPDRRAWRLTVGRDSCELQPIPR